MSWYDDERNRRYKSLATVFFFATAIQMIGVAAMWVVALGGDPLREVTPTVASVLKVGGSTGFLAAGWIATGTGILRRHWLGAAAAILMAVLVSVSAIAAGASPRQASDPHGAAGEWVGIGCMLLLHVAVIARGTRALLSPKPQVEIVAPMSQPGSLSPYGTPVVPETARRSTGAVVALTLAGICLVAGVGMFSALILGGPELRDTRVFKPSLDWQTRHYPALGFSVDLPAEPRRERKPLAHGESDTLMVESSDYAFILDTYIYPPAHQERIRTRESDFLAATKNDAARSSLFEFGNFTDKVLYGSHASEAPVTDQYGRTGYCLMVVGAKQAWLVYAVIKPALGTEFLDRFRSGLRFTGEPGYAREGYFELKERGALDTAWELLAPTNVQWSWNVESGVLDVTTTPRALSVTVSGEHRKPGRTWTINVRAWSATGDSVRIRRSMQLRSEMPPAVQQPVAGQPPAPDPDKVVLDELIRNLPGSLEEGRVGQPMNVSVTLAPTKRADAYLFIHLSRVPRGVTAKLELSRQTQSHELMLMGTPEEKGRFEVKVRLVVGKHDAIHTLTFAVRD